MQYTHAMQVRRTGERGSFLLTSPSPLVLVFLSPYSIVTAQSTRPPTHTHTHTVCKQSRRGNKQALTFLPPPLLLTPDIWLSPLRCTSTYTVGTLPKQTTHFVSLHHSAREMARLPRPPPPPPLSPSILRRYVEITKY